jgi:hypothetical protein
VLKRTKDINDMIESIEENNIDLRNDVFDCENALAELENERHPGTHHIIPGNKISDLMEAWGKDEIWYDEDIAKWSSELWMSLQEFEKHLTDEENGLKKYHDQKINQYNC